MLHHVERLLELIGVDQHVVMECLAIAIEYSFDKYAGSAAKPIKVGTDIDCIVGCQTATVRWLILVKYDVDVRRFKKKSPVRKLH